MNAFDIAVRIIRNSLQLKQPKEEFTPETVLMGAFPDFNSLTITSIIGEIEEQLDCEIDDEELTAEIFESFGSVAKFIEARLQ